MTLFVIYQKVTFMLFLSFFFLLSKCEEFIFEIPDVVEKPVNPAKVIVVPAVIAVAFICYGIKAQQVVEKDLEDEFEEDSEELLDPKDIVEIAD